MGKKVEQKFMNVIGANLDRLITIDWRGQGHIHSLYQAARDKSDGPLTMRAAQKFVDKIKEGDVVFIMASFPVGPFDVLKDGRAVKEHTFSSNMLATETDGVVAAALIARAVDLGFKGKPVVFCEDESVIEQQIFAYLFVLILLCELQLPISWVVSNSGHPPLIMSRLTNVSVRRMLGIAEIFFSINWESSAGDRVIIIAMRSYLPVTNDK